MNATDIEDMIATRLANLKRLYAKDGRMSRYHKIKELEIIIAKIKELKSARRPEPNHAVLPAYYEGGVSTRCGERQVVVPTPAAHP